MDYSYDYNSSTRKLRIKRLVEPTDDERNWERLRRDGTFCDVEMLFGPDAPPIKAHSLILASRNPYFLRTIPDRDLESNEPFRIQFNNELSRALVERLIRFIYYGLFSIPISVEIVMALFKALTKLEIVGIDAAKILSLFALKVNIDNCFDFLDMSKSDNEIQLTAFHATVKRWIAESLPQIIRSEKFLNFSSKMVRDLVECASRDVITDSELLEAVITWIQHDDEDKRKLYIFQLVKTLNFAEVLKTRPDLLNNNTFLEEDRLCGKMLFQVYKEHALLAVHAATSSAFETDNNKNIDAQESNYFGPGQDAESQPVLEALIPAATDYRDERKLSSQKKLIPFEQHLSELRLSRHGRLTMIFASKENATTKMLEFDFMANTVETLYEIPNPRDCCSLAKLNGCIYQIGGSVTDGDGVRFSGQGEMFDRKTSKWSTLLDLFNPIRFTAACVFDNAIYIIGGQEFDTVNSKLLVSCSALKLDFEDMTRSHKSNLNAARYLHANAVSRGRIYVAGGYGIDGDPLSSVEEFSTESKQWEFRSPLNTPRALTKLIVHDRDVYAVGGLCSPFGAVTKALDSVEVFDGQTWEYVSSMHEKRYGGAVFCWQGRIYALGGNQGEPNAEVYDVNTDTWTLLQWPTGLPKPQDLNFFFAIFC